MTGLTSLTCKIARRLGLSRGLMRVGLPQAPAILMYHGVTTLPRSNTCDWEGKHVDADLFRQQISFIAQVRRVVPLTDLVDTLREGGDTSRMVAITFDDGYLNNATTAAGILLELGIPATFFLATGFIDQPRWLWNDRIEVALHRTTLDKVVLRGQAQPVSLATENDRRRALKAAKADFKKLPWAEAERHVVALEHTLNIEQTSPSGVHEFMSWPDASQIVADGFSVGAHSVNHAILSRVTIAEAQDEITLSQRRVSTMLGACSPVFCYPNGKLADYTPEIVDFCKREFTAALSAEFGVAHPRHLYELRRIAIDNSTNIASLAGKFLQASQ